MTAGRRAGALLAAAALTTSLIALLPTGAQAAENAPPTPADDRVEVYPAGQSRIDLLANDTDPEGDELVVCRIGPLPRGIALWNENYDLPGDDTLHPAGPEITVAAERGTRKRTVRITYYVCDFEHVVPATLEVSIVPRPNIGVRRVPGKPGVLRVSNPTQTRMQFLVGGRRSDDDVALLKRKALPAESTISVRVHYRSILWMAGSARLGLVDRGRIADTGWRGPAARPGAATTGTLVPRWAVLHG